jgi:hypothetical protein
MEKCMSNNVDCYTPFREIFACKFYDIEITVNFEERKF